MSSTGAALARHKNNGVYGTPADFLDAVDTLYGPIGFDLAANAVNTVAKDFFSEAQDSLAQDWGSLDAKVLWLNPPFGNIAPWAAKCARVTAMPHRFKVILLLTPASVGANWFRDHVHGRALVLALNGRITFVGETQPYPKDCMLSVYGYALGFDVWNWRKHAVQEP